ncbi:SCO2102 family sporulation regulator [Streptomyces sp. NPDC002144]|uniref:SCO2102 family sporulation regulator n=1 Tax=Streptomyces sp. NPDC006668 TaxID=3156903 RepID=UPI0033D60E49
MGWTVLYIAFGIVALWLLGEVLLQYKARLRWRLLAFVGFLGVVAGVLMGSVVVIGLGAAAFAVGQTYVTLSFRRGFSAGWAVKRPEGEGDPLGVTSKRRRGKADRENPALEVSDLESASADAGYGEERPYAQDGASFGGDDDYDRDDVFTPARSSQPTAAESTMVYEPQPLEEDTGSYGIYGGDSSGYPAGDPSYANAAQSQEQYATAAQGADQTYGYDYSGYTQQQYGYDASGQQQYAAYSDPYIGTQTYGGGYDASYGQYGQQGYTQDQYGTGTYGTETPSGGVWVPQQRTDETYGGELPQEQQYPYQGDGQGQNQGHGNGYDEQQYRY